MIYDHIRNIGLYKGLSPALDLALDYIACVRPDVEDGTTLLEHGVKAVVSSYETRLVNEKGYEAHRQYIDVQYVVSGQELVRCKPLEQVVETIPYDPAKDAARYADCPGIDTVIGHGYFLVVWPDDAHEPCLAASAHPASVKKVVMKVPAGV